MQKGSSGGCGPGLWPQRWNNSLPMKSLMVNNHCCRCATWPPGHLAISMRHNMVHHQRTASPILVAAAHLSCCRMELTQAQLVQRNLHQQLAAAQADVGQLVEAQGQVAALTQEVASLKEQLQVRASCPPQSLAGACRHSGSGRGVRPLLCMQPCFCVQLCTCGAYIMVSFQMRWLSRLSWPVW
jgi:hypothetical protein